MWSLQCFLLLASPSEAEAYVAIPSSALIPMFGSASIEGVLILSQGYVGAVIWIVRNVHLHRLLLFFVRQVISFSASEVFLISIRVSFLNACHVYD